MPGSSRTVLLGILIFPFRTFHLSFFFLNILLHCRSCVIRPRGVRAATYNQQLQSLPFVSFKNKVKSYKQTHATCVIVKGGEVRGIDTFDKSIFIQSQQKTGVETNGYTCPFSLTSVCPDIIVITFPKRFLAILNFSDVKMIQLYVQ